MAVGVADAAGDGKTARPCTQRPAGFTVHHRAAELDAECLDPCLLIWIVLQPMAHAEGRVAFGVHEHCERVADIPHVQLVQRCVNAAHSERRARGRARCADIRMQRADAFHTRPVQLGAAAVLCLLGDKRQDPLRCQLCRILATMPIRDEREVAGVPADGCIMNHETVPRSRVRGGNG